MKRHQSSGRCRPVSLAVAAAVVVVFGAGCSVDHRDATAPSTAPASHSSSRASSTTPSVTPSPTASTAVPTSRTPTAAQPTAVPQSPHTPSAPPAQQPQVHPSQQPTGTVKSMHPATPTPIPGVTTGRSSGGPIPGIHIAAEEQALELIGKVDGFNPDICYISDENPDGSFTVTGQSKSMTGQGGSGTTGVWTVYQDGSYHFGQDLADGLAAACDPGGALGWSTLCSSRSDLLGEESLSPVPLDVPPPPIGRDEWTPRPLILLREFCLGAPSPAASHGQPPHWR